MLQDETGFQASSPLAGGRLPSMAARVMGVLPAAPLELICNAVMVSVLTRYPGIQQRLGEHAGKSFAVDPIDCPFAFVLEPRHDKPRLRVVSSLGPGGHDARISGAALVLLGLLDGTYDGDALFFTRDLTIEGDTAAVLALRNAIEDAELDPGRILGVPERMSPLIGGGLRDAANALRHRLGAPAASPSAHGDLK
jgi:O2-independent ubiquinone biosynthesis accessory factor UbiT